MKSMFLVSLFLFGIAACSDPRFVPFKYATGSPSPETKIILIAGSNTEANFAQEILDQKRLWLSRGIKESEISCYFAPPCTHVYQRDAKQFESLRQELTSCFLADPAVLENHFYELGNQNPSHLYVYVTSHGSAPTKVLFNYLLQAEGEEKAREATGPLLAAERRRGTLRPYSLDVMGGHSARCAERRYVENAKLSVTPKDLHSYLAQLPTDSEKVVALQGCFSGGFLQPFETRNEKSVSLLNSISNLTLLTASRSDRASFGCDPGIERTTFGEVFYGALKTTTSGGPEKIDWAAVHQTVSEEVRAREVSYSLPSLPMMGESKIESPRKGLFGWW